MTVKLLSHPLRFLHDHRFQWTAVVVRDDVPIGGAEFDHLHIKTASGYLAQPGGGVVSGGGESAVSIRQQWSVCVDPPGLARALTDH